MKKSERLNDMMIYLKDKDYFNLSDLMGKYDISKSTALRDIQSLEAIGMPIFVEHGRYGRYGLLDNRLLSPVIFTVDEMYALFFAMLTLQDYQSTPFHLDLARLKPKFEACVSKELKGNLNRMETIFSFASSKQTTDSPFLKEILTAALSNSVNNITYTRSDMPRGYVVQFLKISSSFGQWYVQAYNFESDKLQVFRCDKIMDLSENERKEPIDDIKKRALFKDSVKDNQSTAFEVEITKRGIDMYLKENYPSMSLDDRDGNPIIKGYYHQNEEAFISDYFIAYGKEILSIKPNSLKRLITKKLEHNLDYLKHL